MIAVTTHGFVMIGGTRTEFVMITEVEGAVEVEGAAAPGPSAVGADPLQGIRQLAGRG
jgi:hypothetical protein